jgi:hypothetical protein
MANKKNLATSLIATAPAPATSGTTLVVTTGEGTYFPDAPFYATLIDDGTLATPTTAEIVYVTNKTTDTLTITRAQKGTTAKSVTTTWRIFNGVYAEDFFERATATVASSATPAINTDVVNYFSVTALATNITSFTTNLTGTPNEGRTLWVSITDNGTPRTIAWGASFESSSISLPTVTTTSTRLDVGFIWNPVTSKWRCVAVV